MRLKVATYNIHKSVGLDRRRDPERIIAVLREIDADIIALQEVDLRIGQRASTIPRALLDDTRWEALPIAKRRRSLGWHGNAILARRDMQCLAAGALDLPTLEPRGAAMAQLGNSGERLCVIATHLDLSGLRRRDQIRAILAHCKRAHRDLPTILMGDFNQWGRTTGAMGEFAGNWQVLDTGPSYPSRRPIARLDRIVLSRHWTCVESEVHRSATAARASDHLPVVATLELRDI